MPNPKPSDNFRNVSVLARDHILAGIRQRASDRDLSLNKAATSLIEDALAMARPAADQHPALLNLEGVSTDDLIDELVGRLQQVGEMDVLRARAENAERRVSAVAGALA